MSLETNIIAEVKYMKQSLQKYHKAIDYLLGFLNESQWQQAIEEALTNDELDYSVMEDIFESYVDDWSIDTDVDEVILKACYNVKKIHQTWTDLEAVNTIITNLEAKKD